MKLTQGQIKLLIKEELEQVLSEGDLIDYEKELCKYKYDVCRGADAENEKCTDEYTECMLQVKNVAAKNALARKSRAASKLQQMKQERERLKKQKEEEARKRREREENKNKKLLDLYLKVLFAVANEESLKTSFERELKEIFGRELIQQAIRKDFIVDNYEGGFYLGSEKPVGFEIVKEKLEGLHNDLSKLEDWKREDQEYSYKDLLEEAKGDSETVDLFIDSGLVEKAGYDSYVFNDYEKELAYQLQLFDEEE